MPETQQESGGGGGGGNVFTRKIGPMPMWGWMGIALAVAMLYYFLKKKNSNGTVSGAGTSTGATSVNSPGGVDSSLVPQFVNQTYTSVAPPSSPNINVTVPATPPTATPTPAAQTVSGAPGSYSLDVGGSGNNEWTSTGKYSLNTIAKSHGMTAQQLIAVSQASENNVPLAAYVKTGNYNSPVPSGVQLFIPSANWKTV